MVFIVKVIDGVKKIIPVTADVGAGNPVGTLVSMYKKSNPSGYLYCDGSTFDETAYPLLYAYLGSNVLPDYRECAIVGAEQNTTDTIASHDVFTEGEFKDDCLQNHEHGLTLVGINDSASALKGIANYSTTNGHTSSAQSVTGGAYGNIRFGTTTRGKRKAVYFYIKATSGLSENAQDNVVAQLNEERSYSTSEINTGKKWIDGKDIYRKVIEATLPSSGVGGSLKDLSALHIDYVTNLIAVIYNTTDDYIVMNGGYCFNTDEMTLFFRKTNGILYFYRNNANTSKNAPIKITLEYTKTTD